MKMTPALIVFYAFSVFFLLPCVSGQKLQSDNGDGSFTNPVIAADFPDIDIAFADSFYYMLSTTMFIFPGVPVLKSPDLVNWEYCSNAVQRMDEGQCYMLEGCHRYGRGQWAGSLKFHRDTFYLLFNTLNEGAFLCTSQKAEGPWNMKKLGRGFHDPGLFFDEDGRIYVAHGYNQIYITELDSNFNAITRDSLVYTGDIRPGLEGAHLYKINDFYFLYCTYGGADGFQVALRSKDLYGPYRQKIVINDRAGPNAGIHQGALVQTQSGEWWTMLFLDKGPFGRMPSLQPVHWEDNWPVAGIGGKGVVTYPKPDVGKIHPVRSLPVSDEFEASLPGLQWGWNHNPSDDFWSLAERQGYLRLRTFRVVNSLREAPNTLTQRIPAFWSDTILTTAVCRLEFNGMKNGDRAGLAIFQDPYAWIGIGKDKGRHFLLMVNNGKVIDSVRIRGDEIYLAASASFGTGKASFAWSSDNMRFNTLGNELEMRFNLSVFTGNKFCLFNYAGRRKGGYVDFDWFRINNLSFIP